MLAFVQHQPLVPSRGPVQHLKLHPLHFVFACLPNRGWEVCVCVCMSSLNDGEEALMESRAHVRDRRGDSINLRVQAYSCHPVQGGGLQGTETLT